MNGLTLRISRGGGNKSKNMIGFSPVHITSCAFGDSDSNKELYKSFADAGTTDEQLTILKKIIEHCKDNVAADVIKFLVSVFLQADSKHPVKCFISRHVTKSHYLSQPFTEELASQITTLLRDTPSHYKQYTEIVSKVAMCIENFSSGVAAVILIEIKLASYLKCCLEFCVNILRETESLSPTEKNEIFNLAHLCLRLLLHIIQKGNRFKMSFYKYNALRSVMQQLIFDDDVPMDTKSVCGILYLTMHVMEHGSDSWVDILNPPTGNMSLSNILCADAAELCLYSAIVTVVSVDKLQTQSVDNQPAIVCITHKILHIGERSSSDSTFILGVTRTVLQISKLLVKTTDSSIGSTVMKSLLTFVWSHLDHYMDSVRHLTAQTLGAIVGYCAKLDRDGDDTALTELLTVLECLDKSRKSFYVSVTCLVNELGSNPVLHTWPKLIPDLLLALNSQHIQASATTALETLLQNHAKICSTEDLREQWVKSILSFIETTSLDSAVLTILEALLLAAVKLDKQLLEYITSYVNEAFEYWLKPVDERCILMFMSVARKSGVDIKPMEYTCLEKCTVTKTAESRIMALSLIVESPKTTKEFTERDFTCILTYLKYNINTQSPNFRQLTLSLMKKFMKRLEDSYKVIKRQKEPYLRKDEASGSQHKVEYYLRFVDELRSQCFESLIPGANYSRRCTALQLLVWCERMNLEGYSRTWKPEYVEKLLLHLEDSYENNKALALELLSRCPTELVKGNKYSISMDIRDIFAQASSLKPTDCVSAAYKLDYLRQKLPEYILQEEDCCAAEPVTYRLLVKLYEVVRAELGICEQSVVLAARRAPMYGALHCITHTMATVDPQSISSDVHWTALVRDVINVCIAVNAAVSSVVNNSSPEGHLPMDMSGVVVTDHGNTGGVVLDDGRQVTAQMVLLCAWRSVKEVSLLLGLISSRLTIVGEDSVTGTLTVEQLEHIGEHFTTLLAETKHRGAFEQAYVGFTKLLTRLWRCRSVSLHSLPQSWLSDLTRMLASGQTKGSLCATRRSAGLPFMIQALVTTELQVQGNPKCFHNVMSTLLSVGQKAPTLEARTHSLNILRALFRNAALHDNVAPYVGQGLMLALTGFEGDNWAERNSSTLLFSALMVRVFGVARSRDTDELAVRNKMTGRIFFLRYPQLYDFMLKKLQEVSSSEDKQVLRPSLYPILLLLARLYPSSLEGTVSNLKLVAFIPWVLSCAGSAVLKTRELAAKAMVPLVSPEIYMSHIQSMFALLKPELKRNDCHGILLQLLRLLDSNPGQVDLESLRGCVENTLWILHQAIYFTSHYPCYLIADEYIKVLHLLYWRCPNLLEETTIIKISNYLKSLIFERIPYEITPGRDVCLSNALYLMFILQSKYIDYTITLINWSLRHSSYEVIVTALNYLLILHNNPDENKCKFQEHLSSIANKHIISVSKDRRDYDLNLSLLRGLLNNRYLECQQKSLRILTLEGDTQKLILQAKFKEEIPEEMIIEKFIECLRNEHENLRHTYLESLLNFVTSKLKSYSFSGKNILDVFRIIFEHSSSDNSEDTRRMVVQFIETNKDVYFKITWHELSEDKKFELDATRWCIVIRLLEDDDESLRQRIADCSADWCRYLFQPFPAVFVDRLGYELAMYKHSVAYLTLFALLDFKSVVVTDDGNDECRVFDQNERYNIYLEETIWTSRCAEHIIKHYKKQNQTNMSIIDHISSVIDNPIYKETFDKLCNENIVVFKNIINGINTLRNDALNPKIELFYNKLKCAADCQSS